MKAGPLLFFALLAVNPALADPKTDAVIQSLMENGLAVHIFTRITPSASESEWTAESTKLTLSGRSVRVKLSGEDLLINANLTPYLNDDDTILLIAQGEVYQGGEDTEGVRYSSTFRSLPVAPGEKVVFFPLGLALDENNQFYNIEMEIEVVPYRAISETE